MIAGDIDPGYTNHEGTAQALEHSSMVILLHRC